MVKVQGASSRRATTECPPAISPHTKQNVNQLTPTGCRVGAQVATVLMGLKRSLLLNDVLPGAKNRHGSGNKALDGMRGYASAGVWGYVCVVHVCVCACVCVLCACVYVCVCVCLLMCMCFPSTEASWPGCVWHV